MPYAEFQGSNLGDTGSVWDNGNAFASMVQRGQQVAQSKAMAPLLQKQLAGEIILNAQSQEQNNLAIQKQLAQASLIRPQIDTQLAQLAADKQTALTQLTTQQYAAQMTQRASDEFPGVMAAIKNVTGGGPSTNPTPVPSEDEADDPDRPEGTQPSQAPSSSPASPAAASAAPAAPSTGGLNYESYQNAMNVLNTYRTRFGDVAGAKPMLDALNAAESNLSTQFGAHVIRRVTDFHAAIDTAQSTNDLQTLASDPEYQFAAKNPAWNTGLADQYSKQYDTLQKRQDMANQQQAELAKQQIQIAAEAKANQARLAQEKTAQLTEQASKLGQDFSASPIKQNYNKAVEAVQSTTSALSSKSPSPYAQEQALINYFKLADPTMGVTASQNDILAHLGSLPQSIQASAESLLTGHKQLLTPEQMQELKAATVAQAQPYLDAHAREAKRVLSFAKARGLDPTGILDDDAMAAATGGQGSPDAPVQTGPASAAPGGTFSYSSK